MESLEINRLESNGSFGGCEVKECKSLAPFDDFFFAVALTFY